jgi:hypothetical protein
MFLLDLLKLESEVQAAIKEAKPRNKLHDKN